ncbi:hypothetical protein C5167_039744 [Papaver somniferum]|uniref:Uncharacterized protein n=1 Tax=Papaver somniferum TaxID=3469 RepID=A0A4Y7IFH1_PAPSO|nr:hypothetical protein C5167_039744 [Papaver somniferum]
MYLCRDSEMDGYEFIKSNPDGIATSQAMNPVNETPVNGDRVIRKGAGPNSGGHDVSQMFKPVCSQMFKDVKHHTTNC